LKKRVLQKYMSEIGMSFRRGVSGFEEAGAAEAQSEGHPFPAGGLPATLKAARQDKTGPLRPIAITGGGRGRRCWVLTGRFGLGLTAALTAHGACAELDTGPATQCATQPTGSIRQRTAQQHLDRGTTGGTPKPPPSTFHKKGQRGQGEPSLKVQPHCSVKQLH
jgi:hypothetical protein